ncbi:MULTISPECIES: MalY/PatB family protein [unclassified Streptococcus]|uniref:MalY/PatB family protein n=1 Tax=unclassified Streptococcus TaxID=2608887 RepID=UPI001071E9F3|nr:MULTISPECIES: PatB family C-S lyase [unclassified Streptococcus]MBF0786344.1 putative C-S lyase [Streptococcus sp. 19428wC2_LYSM12]MCQ9212453.1 PatB family C-S lyase [Streptococcus sp. B01]MCQ9213791.1 PatB family C-S lyase [Streptococcus sp. O1]TFV06754.1 putative C-S lyase [Streptococcus sp. LYSM12]
MYNFDKRIDRRLGNSRKWNPQQIAMKFGLGEGVIPLDLADIDIAVAEPIQKALVERAMIADYSYTFVPDEFYEAVIHWNARRFNCRLEKEWIKLTFGTVSTLYYLVQAFSKKGEAIMVNTPAYAPFAEAVVHNDRKLLTSSLVNKENRYYFDFEDMEHQFQTEAVKMYILCSPQNPSGRVWTKEELYQVAELCIRYNVLLVCDEIHRDILFDSTSFTTIANAHPDIMEHCILCLSPNKAFNLGGLKTSYVVIQNPVIRQRFYQQLETNSITSPHVFAVPAVIAAYTQCDDWLKQLTDYIQGNMTLLYECFKEIPEAVVMPAESSFLAWIDVSQLFKNELELTAFFKEANLTMVPGSYFVKDGEGFVRLCVALPRDLWLEVLDRLKKTYIKYKARGLL